MLIRFGLAHALACLPALAVAVGALVAGEKLKAPGAAKAVRMLGLLAAAVLAFVPYSFSYVVWVVDEGDGGALAARRYLLWGGSGTAETLDGRPLPVAVGEGVDVVVNATREALVVEAAHYGSTFGSREKPEALAPGTSRTYAFAINGVGDPPPTARVQESSPVSVRHYIRRAR